MAKSGIASNDIVAGSGKVVEIFPDPYAAPNWKRE
jgi:hypothetical protein